MLFTIHLYVSVHRRGYNKLLCVLTLLNKTGSLYHSLISNNMINVIDCAIISIAWGFSIHNILDMKFANVISFYILRLMTSDNSTYSMQLYQP